MTTLSLAQLREIQQYPPFHIPIGKYGDWILDATGGGAGSMGFVKKFDSPDGTQSVAVKKFSNLDSFDRFKMIIREMDLLRTLNHPHIVRLRDVYTVEDRPGLFYLYHITVYCGQPLKKKIDVGQYSMREVKKWTRQLLQAINHLHINNRIYRNLHPENICIDANDNLTLIGFGNSRVIDRDNKMTADRGTLPYMPIEIQAEWGSQYDEKLDMWSIGTIVCELITGRSLFSGLEVKNTLKLQIQYCGPVAENVLKKMTNESERENIRQYSKNYARRDFIVILRKQMQQGRGIQVAHLMAEEEPLRDFIEHTLQFDPDLRMTAADGLSHRFL